MKKFLISVTMVLITSLAFSIDNRPLTSNLEVSQPPQGAWGLGFSLSNNNLGNNFWPDPSTNDLDSYSEVGLEGRYYLTGNMRLRATAEFFFKNLAFANKDKENLFGGGLAVDYDYIFISTGPICIFAGPRLEIGAIGGNYDSYSNDQSTKFSGETFSAGGVLGAEYFFHSQFSVGASVPILYRFVSTQTNSYSALQSPSSSGLFALDAIYIDLSYYF